jgi:hypothetical protein
LQRGDAGVVIFIEFATCVALLLKTVFDPVKLAILGDLANALAFRQLATLGPG